TLSIGGVSALLITKSSTSLVGLAMPSTVSGAVTVTLSDSSTLLGEGTFTVTTTAAPATQQGSELLGTGNTGACSQGTATALSADGNFALVGGSSDNSSSGAAWAFARSSGTWSQLGS